MRQISKLPRDTGITGWNAVLGAAPSYPEAEGDITADWLAVSYTHLTLPTNLSV